MSAPKLQLSHLSSFLPAILMIMLAAAAGIVASLAVNSDGLSSKQSFGPVLLLDGSLISFFGNFMAAK